MPAYVDPRTFLFALPMLSGHSAFSAFVRAWMPTSQNLLTLLVALGGFWILRTIHLDLMSTLQQFFNSHFAGELCTIFSAPFFALMSAIKYLLAISLTFNRIVLFMALYHHLVAAWRHHFLDLSDAVLNRHFALEAHPLACVTAFQGADAELQAFLVIVSGWVLHRLS